MGKMPYFGRDYASDQARDFVKQQMKKNMASEANTERTRSQMARAAAAPEIAKQTLLAQGDAMLTNARRYTDAGYGVAGRGPTTGGTATESKSSEAFKKGLLEGGVTNPVALAAAMGHAEIESHFDVNAKGDPDKITKQPTAFGIFQWRNERHRALMDFAQKMGRNWLDPYVQGRYAAEEMVSGREFKGGNLLNAKNLDEANRAMLGYLRPLNWQMGLSGAMHGRERLASSEAWYKTLANVKTATGEEEHPATVADPATGKTIIWHTPGTIATFKDKFNDVDIGTYEPVPGQPPDKHGRIPWYYTPPSQVPGARPGAPSAPPVITTAKADPTAQPGAVPTPPPVPTAASVTTPVPAAPPIAPVMPPGVPAMPQPPVPGVATATPGVPGLPPLPGDDEPVEIDPYTGQPRRV